MSIRTIKTRVQSSDHGGGASLVDILPVARRLFDGGVHVVVLLSAELGPHTYCKGWKLSVLVRLIPNSLLGKKGENLPPG